MVQGMIAGGTSGLAEGIYNKDDLEMLFTRTMIGVVGGLVGSGLGEISPPYSGIPGGVAGGEFAGQFYEFFFSFFGGFRSLNE